MTIASSLAIVALAALIHASFQLSVSVLTLLSGHVIGAKKSQAKVLRMTTSFVFGAGVMTLLLLSFTSLVLLHLFGGHAPLVVWAIGCGLLFGVGVAVWLFYYRRAKGTSIWIPRPIAEYLHERIKATQRSAEAFSLGMTSVLGELVFIIAPIIISALVLIQLPALWQLAGIALSLVIVWVLIGSGHKLSRIQEWRESNKYFLQYAAGGGLLILGFFVYVYEILGSTTGGL
jgi:membrane protein YdbS with pleckstrin-like domain